jgi:hypothetical protein
MGFALLNPSYELKRYAYEFNVTLDLVSPLHPFPATGRVKELDQLRTGHSGMPLGRPGTYENGALSVFPRPCAWVPGSRATPAPRNDVPLEFFTASCAEMDIRGSAAIFVVTTLGGGCAQAR